MKRCFILLTLVCAMRVFGQGDGMTQFKNLKGGDYVATSNPHTVATNVFYTGIVNYPTKNELIAATNSIGSSLHGHHVRLNIIESKTNDWNTAYSWGDWRPSNATATNRLAKIEGRTNNWNAAYAHSQTAHAVTANGGFSGGTEANTDYGGAVGQNASSLSGGAVGHGAQTTDGFAGGRSATTMTEQGMLIDAIQLGTGQNTEPYSLQIYTNKLLDAQGHIPKERINILTNITVGGSITFGGESRTNWPTGGGGGAYVAATNGVAKALVVQDFLQLPQIAITNLCLRIVASNEFLIVKEVWQ